MALQTQGRLQFGHALRDHFLFADGFVNLNHGSFGTYPKQVQDRMRELQDRAESQPDRFMRYEHVEVLDEAREAVAKLINCATDETVFVPNATTAINVVLRNLRFKEGEVIVYFSTIYGSCGKTVSYVCETTPAEAREVHCRYPMSDRDLIQNFRDALIEIQREGKRPVIAIFDTIVSMPGVRMPFEALTRICKEEGVLSLIDGAHGIGHIPLDMRELQPDFFASNCHKWLYVPRGCAMLYVPTRNQHLIRSSLPTSHGFEPLNIELGAPNPLPPSSKPLFVRLFEFVGTIDSSPYHCIPAAIAFRQRLGGEARIFEYCHDLIRKGAQQIADILGTEVLENEEGTLTGCMMANIRLPLTIGYGQGQIHPQDAAGLFQVIMKKVMDQYPTFIPVLFDGSNWWARISAQVYLEETDMAWAGDILATVCREVSSEQGRLQAKL